MATDSTSKKLESQSMANAFHFWQLAQEECQTNNIYQQKDACEKAYRAATEAIDTLLAFKGYSVPAGKPNAHVVRGESFLRRGEKLLLLLLLLSMVKKHGDEGQFIPHLEERVFLPI